MDVISSNPKQPKFAVRRLLKPPLPGWGSSPFLLLLAPFIS